MRSTFQSLISSTAIAIALAGCASVVPQELIDARAAYNRARQGPAAQMVPAELHKARESLGLAEQAFSDNPTAQATRDMAYVAERKAQLAEALAAQAVANRDKGQSDQQYKSDQAQIQNDTKGQLTDARGQLAESRRTTDQQSVRIGEEQEARLNAEKNSADAERRMKEMQESLARYAAVKEEARGLVITLSGSVLFVSDKATLLPEAQTRLKQVGDALMSHSKERSLIVEGYTDSRGTDSHNIDLSQRRADAVRDYLVSNGYGSEKIQARGMGKASPIASNTSAEGRANNRRVEIVVQSKKASE